MTPARYEAHCSEIVAQTRHLASTVKDADLTVPVPSCPGWNLGQLLLHVAGAHRWVESIVRTRATEPVPDDLVNDVSGDIGQGAAVLAGRLEEGAGRLADALRAAGPHAEVWTVVPGESIGFWARRMTHETVVHRADAAQAVGADFTVDERVAADGLDEWMAFGSLPQVFEEAPATRELLGPGATLQFHATDTAPGDGAGWLVDLTGDTITWRRAHEAAAVTVRGPLTGLLLAVYGRRPYPGTDVEILGDARLFERWLDCVSYWLHE
ncbi:maleylpyruvate isomerase family mycothiol-dependent enzyme [Streptomyces griseocarneus]|uniref:maleylpyruvate isomerase family mycothiol-dependent enzyme n=1 Tax=Streptomyces griseocarneus TaxID=51201 RepID=UPI00167EDD1C|nr:maleylpyruvate isomerase family mycothiol-dependent enzyme [Streptomyces griseocarneus]MBZ6477773.1 maleylpyruvate isomerase family mycothiol-dependent enzyme [Streptomyces griseocarneus]